EFCMKLVFIYGPPGVGKLTVAKELAKITDYKIFHNHLTVDLLREFFAFGTDQFWRLNTKIRFDIIKNAAEQNVNLIITNVYAKGDLENHVKKINTLLKKHKGRLLLVKLCCHH